MYNLYPDYFQKGEKERGEEVRFIESLLCNELHRLHIFPWIPRDNVVR